MYISLTHTLATTLLLTAIQACTHCPHPGTFTGRLRNYTNPISAYCTLDGVPADAIYAMVSADFYNPPDESPCDSPIIVTNPATHKNISAVVVGQCDFCKGNDLFLTDKGFAALSPTGRAKRAPKKVEWTFGGYGLGS